MILGGHDGVGLLVVYQSSLCPTLSLLGVADLVLEVGLESPRLIVLGGFNIQVDVREDKLARYLLATMATLGLAHNN